MIAARALRTTSPRSLYMHTARRRVPMPVLCGPSPAPVERAARCAAGAPATKASPSPAKSALPVTCHNCVAYLWAMGYPWVLVTSACCLRVATLQFCLRAARPHSQPVYSNKLEVLPCAVLAYVILLCCVCIYTLLHSK